MAISQEEEWYFQYSFSELRQHAKHFNVPIGQRTILQIVRSIIEVKKAKKNAMEDK